MTNLSAWLRVFRPAFQRQFASPAEADIELIDLLRAADERLCRLDQSTASESRSARCDSQGKGRTAG